MQEASSIAKAIEKGWEKAGRPAEFSVKIFEEPQKNFIGMTTKPAKIALFFDEAKNKRYETKPVEEPRRIIERREQATVEKNRPARKTQPARAEVRQLPNKQQAPRADQEVEVRKEKEVERRQAKNSNTEWTPDMVQIVQDWLNQVLAILGRSSVVCNVEVDQAVLKVNFNGVILESASKDKILFRSFAFLLMQLLRSKARKRLRGLKIILATV
jgi:predicted RNA-binding protein Jag